MSDRTEWATADFDEMSWHDVHVHGFYMVPNTAADDGTAELYLDIDYILRWIKGTRAYEFDLAQATLQFHGVFGLKLSIDYIQPSAGMCAFALDGIRRERVVYPTGWSSYRWCMDINWPAGSIEFVSPGFTQRLTGQIQTQTRQWLLPDQRRPWVSTSQ